MSEYIEQNPPFPRLDVKLKKLIAEYYEAEFEEDEDKIKDLKQKIDSIEFKMMLGEQYEVPF